LRSPSIIDFARTHQLPRVGDKSKRAPSGPGSQKPRELILVAVPSLRTLSHRCFVTEIPSSTYYSPCRVLIHFVQTKLCNFPMAKGTQQPDSRGRRRFPLLGFHTSLLCDRATLLSQRTTDPNYATTQYSTATSALIFRALLSPGRSRQLAQDPYNRCRVMHLYFLGPFTTDNGGNGSHLFDIFGPILHHELAMWYHIPVRIPSATYVYPQSSPGEPESLERYQISL
jgi:hypothetical protein